MWAVRAACPNIFAPSACWALRLPGLPPSHLPLQWSVSDEPCRGRWHVGWQGRHFHSDGRARYRVESAEGPPQLSFVHLRILISIVAFGCSSSGTGPRSFAGSYCLRGTKKTFLTSQRCGVCSKTTYCSCVELLSAGTWCPCLPNSFCLSCNCQFTVSAGRGPAVGW
jgi:hypothetical protein